MRSPDQVRWDFVQDWLCRAESDMQAARLLGDAEILDYGVAAFHEGRRLVELAAQTYERVRSALADYLDGGRPGASGERA